MSTAARRRRRRTALVLTGLVALLLVVFLYAVAYYRGWIPGADEDTGDAAATTTAAPQLQPADVIVNVYNATERAGLAGRTADALRALGYTVDAVDNDREGREPQTAAIYFGPEGQAGARLLQTAVPQAELVPDTRTTAEIDLVLGVDFEELEAEATATGTGTGCPVRIVSLLPSATETLFAIGAGDEAVGVTFECDAPPEARQRTIVSTSALPRREDGRPLSPAEIDAAVRERLAAGEDLYHLDRGALAGLDADLVVTQDLCAVCAVDVTEVEDALEYLGCRARVHTSDPHTVAEILDGILDLGRVTGHRDEAERLVAGLRRRLHRLPGSPGRTRRGSSSSSGPTRRSPPVTGCRRWSRWPAATACWAPRVRRR